MVSIPQKVFDKYKEFADCMINDLGVNCKLIYPPVYEDCDNCVFDVIGQKSSGRYKNGGPAPFNFGHCPICKGEGVKAVEDTEIIKLRFYQLSNREIGVPTGMRQIADSIRTAGGTAFVVGFIYDLPKFDSANKILINSDMSNYKDWLYQKATEPVFYGLDKQRYFVAGVDRVDG